MSVLRIESEGELATVTLDRPEAMNALSSGLCDAIAEGFQELASAGKTRVVILTGYASIATAVQAVKQGAVDYLTKPVDIDELERALLMGGLDTSNVPEEFQSLDRHQREYIEYVLARCGGNISEAARRLGIHRQSLQRKLRKFTPPT